MPLRDFSLGVALFALIVFCAGCDEADPPQAIQPAPPSPPPKQKEDSPPPSKIVRNNSSIWGDPAPISEATGIKKGFLGSGSSASSGGMVPGRSESEAVNQVGEAIHESLGFGPTLVVWILDQSASATDLVNSTRGALTTLYQKFGADQAAAGKLKTAVVTVGKAIGYPIEDPTSDASAVVTALAGITQDSNDREMLFTAVKQTLDKFSDFRTRHGHEVMLVLVTDEAGDDASMIDPAISSAKRIEVPVYTIGVPAPFGRAAGAKPTGSDTAIRQGPESVYSERINLQSWGERYGAQLFDSGFGPHGLERLCRQTGGTFLALSGSGSRFNQQWPNARAQRFDSNVMKRYAPDYVSEEKYLELLASNKARMALHEAAKLPALDSIPAFTTDFVKRNEAQLATLVTQAQKEPAKVQPTIDRIHKVLADGESDRDKLTSSRWKAGYDLAMGRASAAKARVDGYNTMLASLKRGKEFQDPKSNTWVLQSVDPAEMTEGGSALKKLAQKARMYLTRVMEEHPGTPWAMIAEKELSREGAGFFSTSSGGKKLLIGWKWSER